MTRHKAFLRLLSSESVVIQQPLNNVNKCKAPITSLIPTNSQTIIGGSTNLNQDSTERCQGTLTANDNLVPTSNNGKDDEIKFQNQPSLTDAVTPIIV